MRPIAWLPWGAAAFERARTERKPVLLSIAPVWCSHSAAMDRTSYAHPAVAVLVAERFVPVRVDPDRRPDLAERYSLGGWPTTAFLTPDGDVLGGGTYVDPQRLPLILERIALAFAADAHRGPPPCEQPPEPVIPVSLDDLVAQVGEAFDPAHGGFGGAPKFPHVAPIRLALDLYRETGSEMWRDVAVTSLDAMGWGPLYDERQGGFFRCSEAADWTGPRREKLLEVNAGLLAVYLDAFETLGLTRYAERAQDVLRYVQTWLADPVDGGWGGSQRSASASDAEAWRDGPATSEVDPTLFAGWNAAMVSSALQAGRVLNDPALSEFAVKSLERVVLLCYRPGRGAAHYYGRPAGTVAGRFLRTVDDRGAGREAGAAEVRGLLEDQVAMAAAHLDAFEATGNVVYRMMAEELALYARRTMWDDGGGFFDRAPDGADVGRLRDPIKPFAANCAAARVLYRLGVLSGKPEFLDAADSTVAAMAGRAAAEGPLAAEYVLAVRERVHR